MRTDMDEYETNAVKKFKHDYGKDLHKVASPCFTNEEIAEESIKGIFDGPCASHVANLVVLGRVARPDISVAVQRVCRVVIDCTTTLDAARVRSFA